MEAKIIEVNIEAKKINLSIKEVNPIDPPSIMEQARQAKDEPADAAPETEEKSRASIGKYLHNTIGDMINIADENK
ncbi:MAG: hypothetical protein ACOX4M_07890 [Acetivibrionales bacterium]